MKKLFYIIAMIGFAVSSCNKPENIVVLEQDVTFKAIAFESGFKSDDVCTSDVAHYALLDIQALDEGGNPFGPSEQKVVDIFYMNNTMYTNTLKLNPGTFELTSFVLMNYGPDNQFGGSGDDADYIVYASPVEGSVNSQIVQGLPTEFTVGAFMKNEVNIEVLCFQDTYYTDFGFTWFAIDFTDVANKDHVFFGDFCTKFFAEYVGTPYASQSGGLRHDMPAIFQIEVFKDETSLGIYNNESWFGEGEPLIVPNPDDPDVDNEEFKFVLSILVKVGANFDYMEFYSWTLIDDAAIPNIGEDKVMDFVLGSCVPDADLILPPYMNLPVTPVVMEVFDSHDYETYMDIYLSGFGDDFTYNMNNGYYGAYCADANTIIATGSYSVNVYSSLYPIPSIFSQQQEVLDNINWLGNNLHLYPNATWQDIQNAIWLIIDPGYIDTILGTPSALAEAMVEDAMNNDGYLPPVGGFAAVLFVEENIGQEATIQLLFTLVDP